MKVKSAPIRQANWKRVRKSLRAELSAYLAAPPKGRACHPREGGASQPHFDDFEALTSSQGVLYLKTSATTIKHLLQPFQKLEKGYGRNLHGFSADIENIKKRLQEVTEFPDRENEIPSRRPVMDFLEQRRRVAALLDVTSDQLRRAEAQQQEIIALRPSAPPSPVPSPIPAPCTISTTTRRGQEHHLEEQAKRKRT